MASEMIERGFGLVLDPMTGGYVHDFDPEQEYEFLRAGSEVPHVFRMSETDPAFNIWGLYYRPRPQ